MGTHRDVPLLTLTVEEAAGLLRIGRTKAYDMTREWRATGGKTGLPVVDCSNVLRVPVHPLAEMLGVEVSHLLAMLRELRPVADPVAPLAEPPPTAPTLTPVQAAPTKPTRNRRKPATTTNQLDLFEHPTAR